MVFIKFLNLSNITAGRHGARLQDHLQRRLEERKQRQRGKLGSKHSSVKMKSLANRPGPSTAPSATKQSVPFKPPLSAAANLIGNISKFCVPQSILLYNVSSYSFQIYYLTGEESAGGSDVERDTSRMTSLPPGRVHLPIDSLVLQVACGLHHTGEFRLFNINED